MWGKEYINYIKTCRKKWSFYRTELAVSLEKKKKKAHSFCDLNVFCSLLVILFYLIHRCPARHISMERASLHQAKNCPSLLNLKEALISGHCSPTGCCSTILKEWVYISLRFALFYHWIVSQENTKGIIWFLTSSLHNRESSLQHIIEAFIDYLIFTVHIWSTNENQQCLDIILMLRRGFDQMPRINLHQFVFNKVIRAKMHSGSCCAQQHCNPYLDLWVLPKYK